MVDQNYKTTKIPGGSNSKMKDSKMKDSKMKGREQFINTHNTQKQTRMQKEIILELPLSSLIFYAMQKASKEKIVNTLTTGAEPRFNMAEPDAIRFFNKMLKEEILKQFKEYEMPVIQLVSNSIDAGLTGNDKTAIDIKVDLRRNGLEVHDNGKGMNLEEILTELLIPFSTRKDGTETIGRLGVGFFSALQYCVSAPNSAKIIVDTCDGKESHRLEFCSSTKDVSGIMCRFKAPVRRQRGTTVRVINMPYKQSEMRKYLERKMSMFNENVAKIFVNNYQINKERESFRDKWDRIIGKVDHTLDKLMHVKQYTSLLEGTQESKKMQKDIKFIDSMSSKSVELPVKVVFKLKNYNERNGVLTLLSQGIFVKTEKIGFADVIIDLPSAIELVEGRDEVKRNDNFSTAARAALEMILDYIDSEIAHKVDKYTLSRAISSVVSLAKTLNVDLPQSNIFSNIIVLPDGISETAAKNFFNDRKKVFLSFDTNVYWDLAQTSTNVLDILRRNSKFLGNPRIVAADLFGNEEKVNKMLIGDTSYATLFFDTRREDNTNSMPFLIYKVKSRDTSSVLNIFGLSHNKISDYYKDWERPDDDYKLFSRRPELRLVFVNKNHPLFSPGLEYLDIAKYSRFLMFLTAVGRTDLFLLSEGLAKPKTVVYNYLGTRYEIDLDDKWYGRYYEY